MFNQIAKASRSGANKGNVTKTTTQNKGFSSQPTPSPNTISDFFSQQVRQYKNKDVLRDATQEIKWVWKDLNDATLSISHGLLNQRLSPKEKLAIYLPSELENVVLQLAAARAGITVAVISSSTAPENLSKALKAIDPKGFAVSGKSDADVTFLRSFIPDINFWPHGLPYRSHQYPSLRTLIHTGPDLISGMIRFKDIRQVNLVESPLNKVHLNPTDAVGSYLSADLSKSWSFTHQNLLTSSQSLSRQIALGPEDRVSFHLPLDTVGGHVGFLAVLTSSYVSLPAKSLEKAVANIGIDSLNVLFITADQLASLLAFMATAGKKKLDSIQRLVIAQGPGYGHLTSPTFSSIPSHLPNAKKIDTVYFLPESGASFFQQGVTDASLKTLGTPLPGLEVKLDKGRALVKGNSVAQSSLFSTTQAQGGWLGTDVELKSEKNLYSLL